MAMNELSGGYCFDLGQDCRHGGTADVFKAVAMQNDMQTVAVKLFKEGFANERLINEAYSRESQILSRLSHPHIIGIMDGGTDKKSGRKYLILEWAEKDLLNYLEEWSCNGWDEFYQQIGSKILDALRYAYKNDVVHRDLKPQNILFTGDGTLKVADFGIGKFKQYFRPGITMAEFKSVPYAPPESDDGQYSDTRDVYGFAVLALRCMSNEEFTTYEEVQDALDSIELPTGIGRILERALSNDPADRQENIAVFSAEISAVCSENQNDLSAKHVCYVRFPDNVLARLCDELSIPEPTKVARMLIAELNDVCSIRNWGNEDKHQHNAVDQALALFTAEFRIKAVLDRESKNHLVVISAWRSDPAVMEGVREDSWNPGFLYKLGKPGVGDASTINLNHVINLGLDEFEAGRRAERRDEHAEKVFRSWADALRAKEEVDRRRAGPIEFDGFEADGNKISFTMLAPLFQDIVGQSRMVELPSGGVVAGEVVSVKGDELVLYSEGYDPELIPNRGNIVLDTRLNKVAIQRQFNALDAVRYARGVRPDLKELLLDPSRSTSSDALDSIEFIQQDLDGDKQEAVGKALCTEDFVVLEGPPGTGKTKFITELIVQFLSRKPDGRILLSSQTHVALDNALERVMKLAPKVKVVRIGRRDDPRISRAIDETLLENQADHWFASSRESTEKFLQQWANKKGISKQEIELGISVGRLRILKEKIEVDSKELLSLREQFEELIKRQKDLNERRGSDTYYEVKEEIGQIQEKISELENGMRHLKVLHRKAEDVLRQCGPDGCALLDHSIDELREWEEELLNSSGEKSSFKKLIDLVEEWHLRFAQTKEFYPAILADSQLVAGTCLGFAGVPGMLDVEYDLCIVDEASKSTATEVLVPLSRAKKWVLVGDNEQLPPFVDEALADKSILDQYGLSREDLEETLFSRLTDGLPDSSRASLTMQYRMVRPIGELVSECFYDGKLKSEREVAPDEMGLAGIAMPVTWLTTSGIRECRERRTKNSYINSLEAKKIVELVERINFVAERSGSEFSVAVLVGYGAQKLELERRLARVRSKLTVLTVECNTVDAFQGREVDIAIYSVTRSNANGDIGFLRDKRRLNVALSRAKEKLIIVGDHVFCRGIRGVNPFACVISHIEGNNKVCELKELRL